MRSSVRRGAGAVVLATAAVALKVGLWERMLCWGATPEEFRRALPGDEVVRRVAVSSTRGITIHRAPDEVWPWIAQLGQGRGGFYSYDGIENLLGLDIHSAETIVPELQHIVQGDEVRLAEPVALTVARVEPGRALVLEGGVPMGAVAAPYTFSWSFVLADAPDGATRLLVRERYGYERGWAFLIVQPVQVASFIMSQKMLRGIKDRAERA